MKLQVTCDDRDEAMALLLAHEAWSALREIDQVCRSQMKHGSPDRSDLTIEKVREIALEALGVLA